MKLTVTTPLAVVAATDDVAHLRAEDETGFFGILPGHADFLTVLSISVVSWRNQAGAERHVAVRGGMLAVRNGNAISIATREAVVGDNLPRLETEVLAAFRRGIEEERVARADAQRLYLAAIRRISRLLKSGRAPTGLGRAGASPSNDLRQ